MREDIHKRLKRLREEQGWTQSYVAGQLGISDKAVAAWEQGLTAPSRKKMPEVAKLYGVSVQYIHTGSNVGDPESAIPAETLEPITNDLAAIVDRLRALVQPQNKVNQKAGMPHKMVLPKSDTNMAKEPVKRRR